MRIKKQVAFALSTLLISAGAVTVQVQPDASPDTSLTLVASAQETPTPTPVNQEPEELERQRQESWIRDRVQSEVDRAFSRTTTLLNALLFVLTLFPIVMAVGFWLLRRSIIYQTASDTKNILDQIRDRFEKQLAAEITAELKGQTEAFKQDVSTIKADNVTQISSLISEAQTVLEELRQQRDLVEQEINRLRDEQYYQTQDLVEQEIPALNYYALSELLEIAADDSSEFVAQHEESASESPSQVFDANDYLQQGNALFSESRYVEANHAYSEAIKIDRNFPEARYQNARCYGIRGKVNLAIGNLQWAIDLDQKYKEMAKTDSAFDAIRENAQFQKMMTES